MITISLKNFPKEVPICATKVKRYLLKHILLKPHEASNPLLKGVCKLKMVIRLLLTNLKKEVNCRVYHDNFFTPLSLLVQ